MKSLLLFASACLPMFSPLLAQNLLRNGSFEGGLLYWHNIKEGEQRLVEDGRNGRHALELKGGYVMSAPFVAERGKEYTISMWAKADEATTIGIGMPPSAREEGQKSGRLWTAGASKNVEVGTDWTRVSVTFPADVPRSGFWPLPHYLVTIGGKEGRTVLVDGVTVNEGTQAAADYQPRRGVEVLSMCVNLPGYAGAAGNIFEKGATAEIAGHFSNPGDQPKTIRARWQLVDYEGIEAVGEAVEETLQLAPGATVSKTVPLPLVRTGCVLARVTALDEDGAEIDRSEFPVTSLPYPKKATRPDLRERFGGSFAGGKGCIEKFQRIGFGWTRWYPQTKWQDLEPERGKFDWHEEQFDTAAAHGVAQHVVLYGWPEWDGIMEGHGKHPLPTDMRWAADDPKWQDLTIETAWDRFVIAATKHYKDMPIVFEIQNEPELDHWNDAGQYAEFTKRTARQIKKLAPDALVMVNNLYGIPSGINAEFLKRGGGEFIDIISWHDYRAGWLADYDKIRAFKQNLSKFGADHVEIWFNEGWAFTNTAVDEEISCSSLTSVESTHAIFNSVVESTIGGQEKTILFHTAYENHGMSFWDYSGPGTMLWDWYDNPLPLVAAWNVLAHHIGISDEIGFTRPPGANFCVFDDLRNGKGLAIAYADRNAKDDVKVALPDFGAPMLIEDAMGNVSDAPAELVLSKSGRPVILYARDGKVDGKTILASLEPLDRKHESFVSSGEGAPVWKLPPAWAGEKVGDSAGSVAMADGRPVWKLEQVWPDDPTRAANYVPMVWDGTKWNVKEGGFGGQPSAQLKDGNLILAARAPHGDPAKRRTTALTFVVPEDGDYAFRGSATSGVWDGENDTRLQVYVRSGESVTAVGSVVVKDEGEAKLDELTVSAKAGDLVSLVPLVDGMFSGTNITLKNFSITRAGAGDGRQVFRLPAAWRGEKVGSAAGNPILAGDTPVWRIDRLYPTDQPEMVSAYTTIPWSGTEWKAADKNQGGQPTVKVENGGVQFAVAGPWQNHEYQKTAGLIFIVPEDGTYRLTGTGHAKPWTGEKESFTLSIRQKDTQRASEIAKVVLPRDDSKVEIDVRAELSAGHELLILPLMPDWNQATNIWIDDLRVTKED